MAELGEANIGGRMVPAWLLDTPAKYLDGDLPVIQAKDDLDSYITPGEYIQSSTLVIRTLVNFPVNLPRGEMCLKVSSLGGPGYICQEIKAKYGLRFRRAIRFSDNGVFQPWEYEDPELRLGVEYRTTERWMDYPVFVQMVDVGPNTDGRATYIGDDVNCIVRAYAMRGDRTPYPSYQGNTISEYSCFYDFTWGTNPSTGKNSAQAICRAGSIASGRASTNYVTIYYCKL